MQLVQQVREHRPSNVHKTAVTSVDVSRNYTQVKNLREWVKSAAQMSNDGLANLPELAYHLRNYVWLSRCFWI